VEPENAERIAPLYNYSSQAAGRGRKMDDMSLYNMLHGMNASLALVMSPFLPIRADEFPRFRDIFLGAEDSPFTGDIFVYTRMGGGNRECWEADPKDPCDCAACVADRIEEATGCVGSYDDDFDCTFRTFVFTVAPEHKNDFNKVVAGELPKTSDWYKARLREMFAESEKLQALIETLLTAA
jgi:hypothetical protein